MLNTKFLINGVCVMFLRTVHDHYCANTVLLIYYFAVFACTQVIRIALHLHGDVAKSMHIR